MVKTLEAQQQSAIDPSLLQADPFAFAFDDIARNYHTSPSDEALAASQLTELNARIRANAEPLGSVAVDSALLGPDSISFVFENLNYDHLSTVSDAKLAHLSTHNAAVHYQAALYQQASESARRLVEEIQSELETDDDSAVVARALQKKKAGATLTRQEAVALDRAPASNFRLAA